MEDIFDNILQEYLEKVELIAEMSCALQIVKRLKGMGFSVKQVSKIIELPESAVLRLFDGKEDIRKIAEDTVKQQIAENDGKIPEGRNFLQIAQYPFCKSR